MSFTFPHDVDGWLTKGEGRLLYRLAQKNPKLGCIVELGTWYGRSAICLAQGSKKAKGGRIYTVDKFTNVSGGKKNSFYQEFQKSIRRYRLTSIIIGIKGDTVRVGRQWDKPIRLLYLDASHDYKQICKDYHAWEKHVMPNGIIAGHDSVGWPGPYRFICYLLKSGKIDCLKIYPKAGSCRITYGLKTMVNYKPAWIKRVTNLLHFKLLSLPYAWLRLKVGITQRGEEDGWYRILGGLATRWKKIIKKM